MDEVKKKVLVDLFGSPLTLGPLAAGLSAFILSWAMDGSTALNLAGLAGVLGGCGVLATRLIFGLEKLTGEAFQTLNDRRRREREQTLDQLDDRLKTDRDPRTEDALRHLRHLYNGFQSDLARGKISGSGRQIVDQVEEIFQACVQQLEHSFELWTTSHELSGQAQQSLLKERESIIDEIQASVDHLAANLERIQTLRIKKSSTELMRLREELEESLRVAQKTEERLAALDGQLHHSEEKDLDSP